MCYSLVIYYFRAVGAANKRLVMLLKDQLALVSHHGHSQQTTLLTSAQRMYWELVMGSHVTCVLYWL